MSAALEDLTAFVAVARAKGFRNAARASGANASGRSKGYSAPGNAAGRGRQVRLTGQAVVFAAIQRAINCLSASDLVCRSSSSVMSTTPLSAAGQRPRPDRR